MKQAPGVHTMPAPDDTSGGRWWNRVDGEWVSRHRYREAAIEAGRQIARTLGVDHVIHGADGGIQQVTHNGGDS